MFPCLLRCSRDLLLSVFSGFRIIAGNSNRLSVEGRPERETSFKLQVSPVDVQEDETQIRSTSLERLSRAGSHACASVRCGQSFCEHLRYIMAGTKPIRLLACTLCGTTVARRAIGPLGARSLRQTSPVSQDRQSPIPEDR